MQLSAAVFQMSHPVLSSLEKQWYRAREINCIARAWDWMPKNKNTMVLPMLRFKKVRV